MRRFLKAVGNFSRNTDGGVLVYFAVLMPVALGLMGLVVDIAVWHLNKRVVQSTADLAAIAAALEMKHSGRDSALAAANEIAAANGFGRLNRAGRKGQDRFQQKGSNDFKERDRLTLNTPPSSGPLQESDDAVEVVLTREVPAFLSALFIKGPVTVAGRAVAVGKSADDCASGYGVSDRTSRDCRNRRAFREAFTSRGQPYAPNGQGADDCRYEETRQVVLGDGTVLEIGSCGSARIVNPSGAPGYGSRANDTWAGALNGGYVSTGPESGYTDDWTYGATVRPDRGSIRAYLAE